MVYLLDRLAHAARGAGSVTFLTADHADERVRWGELYADAVRLAGALQASGAGPGRSVVLLALAARSTVTAAMATWLAGATLTIAPTPARTMDEATYVAETGRRIDRLGDAPLVLVDTPFERLVPTLAAGGRRVRLLAETVEAALLGPVPPYVPPRLGDDDPAILQLTSGTTGSARTVQISHGNLAANVQAIRQRDEHDRYHGRMLSWLPLSHDMGLIGTLVIPMTCGACDVLLASPLRYLADPGCWMRLISEHRATATAGPNSAYALAARLLAVGPRLELAQLRLLTGGETIDPDVMAAFAAAAARHGFDPAHIISAYGMAESVVAVTMTSFDRGLRTDTIDEALFGAEGRAVPAAPGHRGPVRRLVRLGPPIQGMRVRVVDAATGGGVEDRSVGEIQVAGSSLASGYRNDPEATAASRTADGWLRTGDLGYLAEGDLVVTGRAKDVIIVAGRNIYPDDVERAASRADGVRPGSAIAFACPSPGLLGGEGLGVAVETRETDHETVRKSVDHQVRAALGLAPRVVAVLPPGSVPKTPSGKPQRAEARRLFAPAAVPIEQSAPTEQPVLTE